MAHAPYTISEAYPSPDGGTRFLLATESEDDPALTVRENADFEIVSIEYTADATVFVDEEHREIAAAMVKAYWDSIPSPSTEG